MISSFSQFLNENKLTQNDSLHQFISYINDNGNNVTNYHSGVNDLKREFKKNLERFGIDAICEEITGIDYNNNGTYELIKSAIGHAISQSNIECEFSARDIEYMSDIEFEDRYDSGEFDAYKEDAFSMIIDDTIEYILDECEIDNGKVYVERVIRIGNFGETSTVDLNKLYNGHIGSCWTYKKDAGQSYRAENDKGNDVCLCGYVRPEDINFVEVFLRYIKNYDEFEIYVDKGNNIELTEIYTYDYGKVHNIWQGDKIFKA